MDSAISILREARELEDKRMGYYKAVNYGLFGILLIVYFISLATSFKGAGIMTTIILVIWIVSTTRMIYQTNENKKIIDEFYLSIMLKKQNGNTKKKVQKVVHKTKKE